MRIFFDTNTLLDVLIPGRPSKSASDTAMQIIKKCRYEIFVSTQSIIDIYYTAQRCHIDKEDVDIFTSWILDHANVRPIEIFCLRSALQSGNPDFEDSAQLACAEDEECDVFLTSDKGILNRDITEMLVMTPAQFIEKVK
ncbi:MAG: PIN domain-containing protein [Bacteroidales bacterium]|nr:PIN domain-containing protein [Bacteroidales bacterium]